MSSESIKLPFSYLPTLIFSLLSDKQNEEGIIDGIQHTSFLLSQLSPSEVKEIANHSLIFKAFSSLVKSQGELKKRPEINGPLGAYIQDNYTAAPLLFMLEHGNGQSLDPQSIHDGLRHLIVSKEYEYFGQTVLKLNLNMDEVLKIVPSGATSLFDLICKTENISLLEIVVEHMQSPGSWRYDQCDPQRGYFGYDLPQLLYKKGLDYSTSIKPTRSLFHQKALDLFELHGCKIENQLISSMYRDNQGVLDYDLLISLKERLPEHVFEKEHYNAILQNISQNNFQDLFVKKMLSDETNPNGFWFKHLVKKPNEDSPRILANLFQNHPELLSVTAKNLPFIEDFVAIYSSSALSFLIVSQTQTVFADSNWSKIKKIKPYLKQWGNENYIEHVIRNGLFYHKTFDKDRIYKIENIDPFYFLEHMGFKKIKESLIKEPIPVENLKHIVQHIADFPIHSGNETNDKKYRIFLSVLPFWSTAVNWSSIQDYSHEDDLKLYMNAAFSLFRNIPETDIRVTSYDVLLPQLNKVFSQFYQAQPDAFLAHFKTITQAWETPSPVQHALLTHMKNEILFKSVKTISPERSVKESPVQRF